MLTEVTSRINKRIAAEEDIQSFTELISESELFNIDTLLDANFKNLNENGDDLVMFRDDFNFFEEDTQVDAELQTYLQTEEDANDNGHWNEKPDIFDSDLTHLQEPTDYSDNYSFNYSSDSLPNNMLDKEQNYSDTQTTPVSVDEFSNESFDFLDEDFFFEDGASDDGGSDVNTEDFFEEGEESEEELDECGDTDVKEEDFFFEDFLDEDFLDESDDEDNKEKDDDDEDSDDDEKDDDSDDKEDEEDDDNKSEDFFFDFM